MESQFLFHHRILKKANPILAYFYNPDLRYQSLIYDHTDDTLEKTKKMLFNMSLFMNNLFHENEFSEIIEDWDSLCKSEYVTEEFIDRCVKYPVVRNKLNWISLLNNQSFSPSSFMKYQKWIFAK